MTTDFLMHDLDVTDDLKLPALGIDGRYPTMNQMFSMSSLVRPETRSFINIASKPRSKVLDIGPAYGIVCLEALKHGATDYWAIDLDERHLKILIQRVKSDMPQKMDCVKLLVGKFPEDDVVRQLEYETFDAILCEFVLHFLTEVELKRAFRELALLLKPGAELFIMLATPYVGFLKPESRQRMREQIAEFQTRMNLKEDMHIPRCVDNVHCVIDRTVISEEDISNMAIGHGPMSFFDKCTITYLVYRENMEVVSCE